MWKWKFTFFNPFKLATDVLLIAGLWYMPGVWWAKLMVWLGIVIAINVEWKTK